MSSIPPSGGRGTPNPFPECDRLRRALLDCHRRIPEGPARRAACHHLNRSLAECLVTLACPSESEAVRSLCSSGGTALKRRQCQQAQGITHVMKFRYHSSLVTDGYLANAEEA